MSRKWVWIFPAVLLLLIFSGCAGKYTDSWERYAEKGILDLSDWDFSKKGSVSLAGQWAFYWDRLIFPGEFEDTEPTGYCTMPAYWTQYKDFDLSSNGRATYRIVVRTGGSSRLYSMRTPDIYTEYSLWINGTRIDACGSFMNEQAVYLHPRTYDFYSEGPEIEIVMQIKNEAHAYGGIGQNIRLGTPELIHREYNVSAGVDLILISICLFTGFYFLILFLFRKKNREFVWFFVLCISVAVRNLFSNATLIMQLFPGLPFWLGSRIVTLTIPSIIVSMLLYTWMLFKNEMPATAFKTLMSVNILYAFLVLILPSGVYSRIFFPYLVTVGAACALGIHISVKAVVHGEKDAVGFMSGMLLLSTGALLDSLSFLQTITIGYLLSSALFAFIVIQTVLLAKRYSETFLRTELLSEDLQASLDKIMITETAYLSAQMKPHFLYNALTAIAENCETAPEEAGRLILSLSKYLRQTLDYDNLNGFVPLKKELELVYAYTSIEKARFDNIEIIFDLPDSLPSIQIPPLTLQPLVENAIKHGLRRKKEGGHVVVRAEYREDKVEFLVEDNGIGIPDDTLKNLAVLPNGSVSIGLYNINTRLIRLYGNGLSIKSEIGTGTSVSFEIPYRKEW